MAPKRVRYSEEAMTAACQAFRSGTSLRTAAKEYGVPLTTLRDRLRGRLSIRQKSRTVLSPEEEEKLVDWLQESARQGFVRTKQQLVSTVESVVSDRHLETCFTNNRPGRKWYANFMKRHKEELSLCTPQGLRSQRAAVAKEELSHWFHQAKIEIDAVDPGVLDDPSRIFNCDESGFQLGGGICPVLARKSNKRISQITSDTHKQITVLACGNAAGEVQPPLLIFPGQRFRYDPLAGFPEAHLARSRNGWIDAEIFQTWFETAFCPGVAHLQKPVVLFADGHAAHLSPRVHDLCKEHGIILCQFPSQARHVVQPLDFTTFERLKQVWREEVMFYQDRTSTTLSKKDFAAVFRKAWNRGLDKDIVISGFQAAGIFPWNPEQTETGEAENVTWQPETEVTDVAATLTLVTEDRLSTPSAVPSHVEDVAATLTLVTEDRLSTPSAVPSHVEEVQTVRDTSGPNPTQTSQTLPPTLDAVTTLDRLLDLTAKAECQKLFHYRTKYQLGQRSDGPEERQFCQLYSQIRRTLQQCKRRDSHRTGQHK